MSDDIAEFLRRAAQRRSQRAPAATPPPPPEIEILDAEVIDAEILESPSGEIAQQVAQHMDSSVFSDRAAQLGKTVDRADDRMEAHLQDVFEHKLGQLGTTTSLSEESVLDDDGPKPPTTTTPQISLAEMLSDPQNLRNAIIVREILNRPEHLW